MIDSVDKINSSEIHHSASIVKSNLPYIKIKCDKGKRFKGRSKMSINKLVLHGLNGMTIFMEIILIRFFILSIIGMALSAVGIVVVIFLKLNNLIGVLNWATNTTIGFTILFAIFLLTGFLSLLTLLNRNVNNNNDKKIKLSDIILSETTIN